jgi:aspartate racemase
VKAESRDARAAAGRRSPSRRNFFGTSGRPGASTGIGGSTEREGLSKLAETLIRRDALDAIILAGTDLALIFDKSNTSFPHVDRARVHLDQILGKML